MLLCDVRDSWVSVNPRRPHYSSKRRRRGMGKKEMTLSAHRGVY